MVSVWKRPPLVTCIICAAAIAVFYVSAAFEGTQNQYDVVGYFWSGNIFYDCAQWTLLSSALYHVDILHLAFNLYWLYVLGSIFERRFGALRFAAFFASAALFSSGMQVAASGSTSVGASGAGYALFGFLLVARRLYPEFKAITKRITQVFLIWLVVCWLATLAGIADIGNAAHLGGFIYGAVAGALVVRGASRTGRNRVLLAMCAVAIIPAFWAPWTVTWNMAQAGIAAEDNQPDLAIEYCKRTLKLDSRNTWALSELAREYQEKNDLLNYEATIARLRAIDKRAAAHFDNQPSLPNLLDRVHGDRR